jgi:hypothetical protein
MALAVWDATVGSVACHPNRPIITPSPVSTCEMRPCTLLDVRRRDFASANNSEFGTLIANARIAEVVDVYDVDLPAQLQSAQRREVRGKLNATITLPADIPQL